MYDASRGMPMKCCLPEYALMLKGAAYDFTVGDGN